MPGKHFCLVGLTNVFKMQTSESLLKTVIPLKLIKNFSKTLREHQPHSGTFDCLEKQKGSD